MNEMPIEIPINMGALADSSDDEDEVMRMNRRGMYNVVNNDFLN